MECQNYIESGVKSATSSLLPLLADVLDHWCGRCQRVEVCPVLSVEQVSMLLSNHGVAQRHASPETAE